MGFEAEFALTDRKKRTMSDSKFGRPEVPPMAGRRGIHAGQPSYFANSG